jgi:phage shock protein PspC (stress-responsive transcriptional regulator)
VREPDDRKIAGVCSGLADYMGIDVTVMRVSFVALALITPVALIAYLVAAMAVPERRPDQPRVRARRVHLGSVPHPVLVVGAIVAVAALIDEAWWLEPLPAAVALVGVGVWLIVEGRDGEVGPPTSSPPRDASDRPWPGGSPPADAPTTEPFAAGPAGTTTEPFPAGSRATTGAADDATIEATAGRDEGATLVHPMAASPWVVSVWQHSNAEGDADTTLTASTLPPGPSAPPETGTGAGSPGEIPPPASPWWSGGPAVEPTHGTAPVRRRRRTSLAAPVASLLLVGAGVLWLLAGVDVVEVSGTDALALGLVAVGAALIVASWRGRAYALVPIGAVLVGLLVLADTLDVPLDAGTGNRTVVVDSAAELSGPHEVFAGALTVDLTEAPLARSRTNRLEASVGMGKLRVIVPVDAHVEGTASSDAGQVVFPGQRDIDQSGLDVEESFTIEGDGPRLDLDLSVAFGTVEVIRG